MSSLNLDPVAVERLASIPTKPVPEVCPHCGDAVVLAENALVYGKPYGHWPYVYLCLNGRCGAYVGLHPGTTVPLGTLATAPMRKARKAVKDAFNPLWRGGGMRRGQAYARLADAMGIPLEECHIGWFDEALCEQALKALAGGRLRQWTFYRFGSDDDDDNWGWLEPDDLGDK